MPWDSREFRRGCALLAVVALSAVLHGQQSKATAHYTILTRDGSTADVAFARRWLDAAEQLMATKYHVVPNQYDVTVHLLDRPENDIDASTSGSLQCCTSDDRGRKTGTIFLLGPSASIWKERALTSSLGLPKEGEDYQAKVLMSEYIPIGHYAVQDARSSGGWQYYSGPEWFVQGLQEYDAIYHTTETNRTKTSDTLRRWARQNEARFACCTNGMELADVYNGGAVFLAFLASEFGEGIHERILHSSAQTFGDALTNETKPHSLPELFSRFRAWVMETK